MNDNSGYAVFFFPNALEALGEAIKPYLQDGPLGAHIPCREVDTSGAFVELTVEGQTAQGQKVALDLMVPGSMVRMIVSNTLRSPKHFALSAFGIVMGIAAFPYLGLPIFLIFGTRKTVRPATPRQPARGQGRCCRPRVAASRKP